jgi:hypothetical protein
MKVDFDKVLAVLAVRERERIDSGRTKKLTPSPVGGVQFSQANSKLNHLGPHLGISKCHVQSFDLPAGWTCPAANLCFAKVDPITRLRTLGACCQFVCYATKAEYQYDDTLYFRWRNYIALMEARTAPDMADLILAASDKTMEVMRTHSSGDFFSREYFKAWTLVAEALPQVRIWGYTKMAGYVMAQKPDNFRLIYSHGGKYDTLADTMGLPQAYVVGLNEAPRSDAPVICEDGQEHQDFWFVWNGKSFSLRVH